MDPFIAQIMMFGGNFAPRGWAFCQGQLLSISANNALFSLLGTQFGGDGRTTFGLPDLQGRTPIGYGHGNGLTPRSIGQKAGQEYVTLTEAQMPQHSHSANLSLSGGGVLASTSNATKSSPANGDYLAAPRVPSDLGTSPAYGYVDNAGSSVELGGFNDPSGTVQVGTAGGSQSHNNMQPFLVIPYIIALEGIYPSRN